MATAKFQVTPVPETEKRLHDKYGHQEIEMIRGAGELHKPDVMLMFMNPTARNIASNPDWKGLRAPWIGIKKVWQMLAKLGLLDDKIIADISELSPLQWTEETAARLYAHVAERGLYITNLASCTQPDARHLKDALFREYLPVVRAEIQQVRPKKIIPFGNQVSSILLQKNISVSNYGTIESEKLAVGKEVFDVFPTYYPVGQGQRNMPKAIDRIRAIMDI